MTDQATSTFQKSLRGRLIRTTDADYDAVRALYNCMIDKRPCLIACCVDVADVITAVNFGREQGLLLAIRGGGHNGPGFGSCDDGLVIDLSMMKSVRLNPENRTVRVEHACSRVGIQSLSNLLQARPLCGPHLRHPSEPLTYSPPGATGWAITPSTGC